MCSSYDIITNGEKYKFRTTGYDPYSMFRGRYITIYYKNTEIKFEESNNENEDGDSKQKMVYVTIKKDKDGFAYFDKKMYNKKGLVDGEYYTITEGGMIKYSGIDNLPDRYYMNEKDAVMADSAYQKASEINMTYAVLAVRKGRVLLRGLYIYDMPIEKFLKLSEKEQDKLYKDAVNMEK